MSLTHSNSSNGLLTFTKAFTSSNCGRLRKELKERGRERVSTDRLLLMLLKNVHSKCKFSWLFAGLRFCPNANTRWTGSLTTVYCSKITFLPVFIRFGITRAENSNQPNYDCFAMKTNEKRKSTIAQRSQVQGRWKANKYQLVAVSIDASNSRMPTKLTSKCAAVTFTFSVRAICVMLHKIECMFTANDENVAAPVSYCCCGCCFAIWTCIKTRVHRIVMTMTIGGNHYKRSTNNILLYLLWSNWHTYVHRENKKKNASYTHSYLVRFSE